FTGIVHILAAAERCGDLSAPNAEVVFVDNEKWCAVLLRQRDQWNAGYPDNAVIAADRVARPDVRRQPQEFLRCLRPCRNTGVMHLVCMPQAGQMGVHIRSGALTPRMASPLEMTWRVAWHSARRAVCSSLGSSSPCGNTRHES